MTEIKVVMNIGPRADVRLVTVESRDLFLQELVAANPTTPMVVFDSFADMQALSLTNPDKPELVELLFRKVLKQTTWSLSNSTVTAIVPALTGVSAKTTKLGGAVRRGVRTAPTATAHIDTPGSIRIRMDTRIRVITEDNQYLMIPVNEEIVAIGIIITPRCFDGGDNVLPRLVAGNYTYPDVAASCDDVFLRGLLRLRVGGDPVEAPVRVMFRYLTPERVHNLLSDIYDRVIDFNTYVAGAAALIVHAQLNKPSGKLKGVFGRIKPSQAPAGQVEPSHSGIISTLESLHYGKFTVLSTQALMADIHTRGFTSAYNRAIVNPADPKVTTQIAQWVARKTRMEFAAEVKAKLATERNRVNAYRAIVEKKFGAERAAEFDTLIARNQSVLVDSKQALGLLSPNEQKPVLAEYTRREQYLEAVIKNKCPHVREYRQLRNSTGDISTRQHLRACRDYFEPTHGATSMIKCRLCKFNIMCPHVYEYISMDVAGATYQAIKAKMTKFIDKAGGSGGSGGGNNDHYCKICGEVLLSTDTIDSVTPVTMDEELKNFMWGEVASLTKYLTMIKMINVPLMITSVRDAIYPHIFELEKQILKSKTNSVDEIKAKKKLYVCIYAFAYLIHLASSSRRQIGFKDLKSDKPVELVKHVLGLIMLSRNVVIKTIPGMTGDLIKNKLIEAYKVIQSAGSQSVVWTSESENMLVTLMLDPVYRYLYSINMVDDLLAGKKPKTKFDLVDRVDEIMGAPLATLERSNDLFAKVKVPKFDARWRLQQFDKLTPASFHNAATGYAARCFELFHHKLKTQLFNEPLYVEVGSVDGVSVVKLREPHLNAEKQYLTILQNETLYLRLQRMQSLSPYSIANTGRVHVRTSTHLGRLYDLEGRPHKWGIYILDDKTETTVKIIAKDLETDKAFTKTVVDKKCTVCNGLLSQHHKLDENTIREKLNANVQVDNFYRFYENRCPTGGLHELDGNKCKKCNWTPGTTSTEYYTTYLPVYTKDRADMVAPKRTVVPIVPTPLTQYDSEYESWTHNFNVVLDLSKRLQINHRLISALGAVEKIEYADVIAGSYIPLETEERNATRIYTINGYMKALFTEYNQLKFFHRLTKPTMELSAIVDSSGIDKHKIPEVHAQLPDIFNDYNARFETVRRIKKPRETVLFTIQSFCEACLLILSDTSATTAKLRADFVAYVVAKTLRAEELVTKPGYFSWSLLYGDRDTTKTYDSNTSAETPDEYVSDDEDASPLGLDALDTEADPNNDDDNDANEVNVEGYGLD